MVQTGLEIVNNNIPAKLKGKRIGVLCHAPSITNDFKHILEIFFNRKDCKLSAVFGPQHGLFGQTQDNMIEWEGHQHPLFKIPVFSLYGKNRKPSPGMLKDLDLLLVDLQDVGTRPYTYIWTIKLCIEACSEQGIPVWILDRPNPIGKLPFDGPVLKKDYFTFVGGASIPLCHRMTIGELAIWIRDKYYPGGDLNVVWMRGWKRNSLYSETGLPWVLPSPNMPTLQTAMVYPGTVLIEGLNISEGRGSTIPFELLGAPFLNIEKLIKELQSRRIPACAFRTHNFIPTFNKYKGEPCNGLQIHITDASNYYPAGVALEIFDAIAEISGPGVLQFNLPPYEYENELIPFDILSGDNGMRTTLLKRMPVRIEKERWKEEIAEFKKEFEALSAYPE
jgi:uncharacterized protein YbbC (DUF1343 family)